MYKSPSRDAAREATRTAIVDAANATLQKRGWAHFSIDVVARAAGVTRLTVYHQFGDRRALLEAVFDAQAKRAGFHRIAQAMAVDDPRRACARVVDFFCEFWATSKPMHAVMAATAGDDELAQAIAARNERRRTIFDVLVKRMVARGDVASKRAHGLVDTLFALTSFAFHEALTTKRSKPSDVHDAIAALVRAAIASRR